MRNYVIGTSDHAGRHLNMVQAENIQAALERAGVIDPGKIPRRDMETHADVDYIYIEEPTGAVDTCENEHVIPYPEIRTVGDLKAFLASIPDNYDVTLGSDSVAVPDGNDRIGTTYDHGAYEVDTSVSHITTLQVNRELRELYIGLTLLMNNLRV